MVGDFHGVQALRPRLGDPAASALAVKAKLGGDAGRPTWSSWPPGVTSLT